MKAITANLLSDGAVVYLDESGEWTAELAKAARYEGDAAEAALADAKLRATEIADVYLIEVSEDGAPAGRATLRETIRTAGPTVREDLGYQAGA